MKLGLVGWVWLVGFGFFGLVMFVMLLEFGYFVLDLFIFDIVKLQPKPKAKRLGVDFVIPPSQ